MRRLVVNLPVKDLSRSKAFFASLGFGFDPKLTGENVACVVIEKDASYATLVAEPLFETFIPSRAIADAKKSTEVLVALSCSSDQEVRDLVGKAIKAGGRAAREAKDHGHMYEQAFEDLDGHLWQLIHTRGDPQ